MKPNGHNCIVIAAKPGILRNSLCSYLRAIPGVQAILLADDATALQIVRESTPGLVILDSDLAQDKVLALIRDIRAERPEPKTIVLSESAPQQRLYIAAGASHALLKGFLDQYLREAVLGALENGDWNPSAVA